MELKLCEFIIDIKQDFETQYLFFCLNYDYKYKTINYYYFITYIDFFKMIKFKI